MKPSHIRSYVRRQGRMTSRQKHALTHHFSRFGVDLKKGHDFKKIFSNASPILVEIGFGMGESLAKLAEENLKWNFIGVDVHRPGIGALLAMLNEKKLTNVKIIEQDAVQLFQHYIPPNHVDMIQILFPDPWPKKRHHKRRLIQQPFLNLLLSKLKQKGMLYIVTDWENYAHHIQILIHHCPVLKRLDLNSIKHPFVNNRLPTKFQTRGLKKGHQIYEFLLEKHNIAY